MHLATRIECHNWSIWMYLFLLKTNCLERFRYESLIDKITSRAIFHVIANPDEPSLRFFFVHIQNNMVRNFLKTGLHGHKTRDNICESIKRKMKITLDVVLLRTPYISASQQVNRNSLFLIWWQQKTLLGWSDSLGHSMNFDESQLAPVHPVSSAFLWYNGSFPQIVRFCSTIGISLVSFVLLSWYNDLDRGNGSRFKWNKSKGTKYMVKTGIIYFFIWKFSSRAQLKKNIVIFEWKQRKWLQLQ